MTRDSERFLHQKAKAIMDDETRKRLQKKKKEQRLDDENRNAALPQFSFDPQGNEFSRQDFQNKVSNPLHDLGFGGETPVGTNHSSNTTHEFENLVTSSSIEKKIAYEQRKRRAYMYNQLGKVLLLAYIWFHYGNAMIRWFGFKELDK